jgi:NAD(P)-dependent dehydrogenase (short-subunit alcohol dehydrogenase family)
MPGRVEGRIALVVGGGQTPGATIGNGRATAELLAREGAKVAVADLHLERAQETVDQIKKDGGDAIALQVDVTSEESCKKLI